MLGVSFNRHLPDVGLLLKHVAGFMFVDNLLLQYAYVGNNKCFTLQRHAATCHRAVPLMCVCVRNDLRCNPVTPLSFSYVLLFHLL
jgi:hypothetical protein